MVLILVIALFLTGVPPSNSLPSASDYRYRDLMPKYWEIAKQNSGPARVKQFRTLIIDPNLPVFKAVAAPWLTDEGLTEYLHRLEEKSPQLREAERGFPDRMAAAWRGFQSQVPDMLSTATVYLVPAPRSAVGGAVRPLGDENILVFGAEEVSTVTDSQLAFNVLAQHELTHLYQMQVNPEIKRMIAKVYMPPYATDEAKLYQVLWLEGLAAYTSKALNPSATDEQVLLSSTVASGVHAQWKWLRTDLLQRLDSSRKEDIDAYLFDADSTGRIPRRGGYYIGMLIAQRLAKQYSFSELCRLQGKQLRSEVERALRSISSLTGKKESR